MSDPGNTHDPMPKENGMQGGKLRNPSHGTIGSGWILRGGGHRRNSCKIRTSRLRPSSMVSMLELVTDTAKRAGWKRINTVVLHPRLCMTMHHTVTQAWGSTGTWKNKVVDTGIQHTARPVHVNNACLLIESAYHPTFTKISKVLTSTLCCL